MNIISSNSWNCWSISSKEPDNTDQSKQFPPFLCMTSSTLTTFNAEMILCLKTFLISACNSNAVEPCWSVFLVKLVKVFMVFIGPFSSLNIIFFKARTDCLVETMLRRTSWVSNQTSDSTCFLIEVRTSRVCVALKVACVVNLKLLFTG